MNITGGIGLQINPSIEPMLDQIGDGSFDYAELLCDSFAGSLDSGFVIEPSTRPLLEKLAARWPVIAHGNYGEEFGFAPLEECSCVQRHVEVARAMESPWYADHIFYGDACSSYMWSSPLQFSRAELERIAGRAARLQDLLKMPLLHENPFYYASFPGTDVAEAEFMASLVEKAGTYLLLDLHNIYANSINFSGYDRWSYLRTVPLDRVVEIHLAGGQNLEGWYHDLHNHAVPEAVWNMLDFVVARAPALRAVVLEVQGPGHTARSRQIDERWVPMIQADLARAKAIFRAHRG